MSRQTNTKERIISSAFLTYRKMLFKEVSLSDIARSSEITKAAIFRHFKNKAELFSTMNDRFFDAFEVLAEKIAEENGKHTFAATYRSVDYVFEFDKEHPGYIDYYIQSLLCDEKMTARIAEILTLNKIPFSKENSFDSKTKWSHESILSLYIEITILNFWAEVTRALEKKEMANGDSDFRMQIAKIIFEGLGKERNPISPERRKELDELCKVKFGKNEKSDRFFEAFLKVIQKNHGRNVTVEKITNELGISKSSMYAFFSGKTDYLKNMLRQEIEFFAEVLQEKCAFAENIDEVIYVLLRGEVNYFSEHPQLILMHAFFTYHDMGTYDEVIDKSVFSFLSESLPTDFSLGFGNAKGIFIKWISVLAISFLFMGKKHDFPSEWRDFFVSAVYEFIECGAKSCIKLEDAQNRLLQ